MTEPTRPLGPVLTGIRPRGPAALATTSTPVPALAPASI